MNSRVPVRQLLVNDWTMDFGERGRQAVTELLRRGHETGVIPQLITPEFIDAD